MTTNEDDINARLKEIMRSWEISVEKLTEEQLGLAFLQAIKAGDFKGEAEEIVCHYPSSGKEEQVLLIGLGKEKELTKETIRLSYAKAVQILKKRGKSVNVQLPVSDVLEEKDLMKATFEGVLLAKKESCSSL